MKKRSNTRAILPRGVAQEEQLRSTGRHAPSSNSKPSGCTALQHRERNWSLEVLIPFC